MAGNSTRATHAAAAGAAVVAGHKPLFGGGGGGGGGFLYPLADDGTVAGMFGGMSHLPTDATLHNQTVFTYSAPGTAVQYLASPVLANLLTSQAIAVPPGKILVMEACMVTPPAHDHADVGLLALESSGGTSVGTNQITFQKSGGAASIYGSNNGFFPSGAQALVASETGYRFSLIFDGNTGFVFCNTSDGLGHGSGRFTPGNSITFFELVKDDATATAGDTVAFKIVPAGADMLLPAPAGAVDGGGGACPGGLTLPSRPTVTSLDVVTADAVRITLSENLYTSGVYDYTKVTIKVNGTPVAMSGSNGYGVNSFTVQAASNVFHHGDTVTMSYDNSAGFLGNNYKLPIASFTDQPVTNTL